MGAHYTPRAYVERLVLPTVIEPLRERWQDVQTAAVNLAQGGKVKEAAAELKQFHYQLTQIKVLDPACGTGNFLYVTLEHLKRLEGEVLNMLASLGQTEAMSGEGFGVDPHQLLGIEINPRAAAIAEVVLWIGYLQWHYRTRGDVRPAEPIVRDFGNIENRDAVLAFDRVELQRDAAGKPLSRWDGKSFKVHPVTGKHRTFQFLDASILPDNMIVAIATARADKLAILSARIHVTWALAAGGRLGVGNDALQQNPLLRNLPLPRTRQPNPRRQRATQQNPSRKITQLRRTARRTPQAAAGSACRFDVDRHVQRVGKAKKR